MIKIRPEIPVILCTGYSQQITTESTRRLGVKELILKPMVMDELAKTVRRNLTGSDPKTSDGAKTM